MPGYEGSVLISSPVRLTRTRVEPRSLRCRPGTFEWRYGRANANTALYHAGSHFARLWEKAGVASAGSVKMEFNGPSQWKGMPDSRLAAMQEIDSARSSIGKWGTARLVDYCVMGTSVSDIAAKYGKPVRDMAAVLDSDLRACAYHFRFL